MAIFASPFLEYMFSVLGCASRRSRRVCFLGIWSYSSAEWVPFIIKNIFKRTAPSSVCTLGRWWTIWCRRVRVSCSLATSLRRLDRLQPIGRTQACRGPIPKCTREVAWALRFWTSRWRGLRDQGGFPCEIDIYIYMHTISLSGTTLRSLLMFELQYFNSDGYWRKLELVEAWAWRCNTGVSVPGEAFVPCRFLTRIPLSLFSSLLNVCVFSPVSFLLFFFF